MPGSATQYRPLSSSLGHTFLVSSIVSSRLFLPSRDLNKLKIEKKHEGDFGFCLLLVAEAMARTATSEFVGCCLVVMRHFIEFGERKKEGILVWFLVKEA